MPKRTSTLSVVPSTPNPDLFPGTTPAELVTPVHGQPMTTSRRVAGMFGKRHDNVLTRIRSRIETLPDDFAALNFEESSYTGDDGQQRPEYLLTEKGFLFVAMGFTGAGADRWKVAFVNAFDAMAKALQREQRARLSADRARIVAEVAKSHSAVMTVLEDIRREQGKETGTHHYINEARLIGFAMTGIHAGIDRDTLDEEQLRLLHRVETQDIKLLVRGLDYEARKAALCEFVRAETSGATPASLPGGIAQLNFEPSERVDDNGGTH